MDPRRRHKRDFARYGDEPLRERPLQGKPEDKLNTKAAKEAKTRREWDL
jgi:hypothetical protein